MRSQIAIPRGQAASIANVRERQAWSYFDFQDYAAAGQQQLTYFQQPRGQGGRTAEDTNFPGAGALPQGIQFVMQEVQFLFIPGAAVPVAAFGAAAAAQYVNDVHAVGSRGFVELRYSNKNLIEEGPLMRFPPDVRMDGFGALADATTAGANLHSRIGYSQWAGKPFRVADVLLEPMVNFSVTVSWPKGVVALPSGQVGRLGCFLRGYIDRRAQ